MLSRARAIDPRLLQRQCVVCGYDGALLRNGRAERCARCGCDLHERPARSYAEMEGLTEPARRPLRPRPILAPSGNTQLVRRWCLFMLMVLCVFVVTVTLFAAAISG